MNTTSRGATNIRYESRSKLKLIVRPASRFLPRIPARILPGVVRETRDSGARVASATWTQLKHGNLCEDKRWQVHGGQRGVCVRGNKGFEQVRKSRTSTKPVLYELRLIDRSRVAVRARLSFGEEAETRNLLFSVNVQENRIPGPKLRGHLLLRLPRSPVRRTDSSSPGTESWRRSAATSCHFRTSCCSGPRLHSAIDSDSSLGWRCTSTWCTWKLTGNDCRRPGEDSIRCSASRVSSFASAAIGRPRFERTSSYLCPAPQRG